MSAALSPCTGVCRIDGASGWCNGCARTMAEIADWPRLAESGKRAVLAQLPARRLVQAEKSRQPAPR